MNRCFSKQDRKHLYLVADGRCAKCRGDLLDDWEAHHVKRYADGGLTSLTNAVALCRRCHVELHRGNSMGLITPRGWQVEAIDRFTQSRGLCFLLEATPGAGKTIYSGLCAQHLLDNEMVDFVVCVVPTTALKGDASAGFLGDFHKAGVEITTVLKEGRAAPKQFSGAVITYAQLPNMTTTFETWARNGLRLFFIFDEIHHATEQNTWGSAAESCGRIATKILGMTGTPFRGDGRQISFVRYDGGKAVADFAYAYKQAVAEDVCRRVLFIHDDGVAEYILDEQEQSVMISAAEEEQVAKVSSVIFRRDAEWLNTVLAKADEKLDEYRIADVNAGGLVICRPGTSDDDDRHLEQVAKSLREITGTDPVIVKHDDPDANAKIERFRKSQDRWIVAVRKISEGVDIKRLRVLVLASYPGTELLFRQVVGRVVRVEDPSASEDATVYMAKFPRLVEFANRISEEADAGMKLKKERKPGERGEQQASSNFTAIGSTHEDGGGVSSLGEQFAALEINFAEVFKRGDRQLSNVSVAAIAHILRKAGVQPEPDSGAGMPLHVQKMQKRKTYNTLARRVAIKMNSDKPDFKLVHSRVFAAIGVNSVDDLFDNHDIAKIDAAIGLLESILKQVDIHEAA
jgi:superfamily II DNA or RNA helicase